MNAPDVISVSDCRLRLARDWEAAWREAVRPWLAEPGFQRSFVLVPARAVAQALKKRALLDGVPLIGIEWVTPGLARRKGLLPDPHARPLIGRELLALGLQAIVRARLGSASAGSDAAGFLASLDSHIDGAIDDFDDLLRAGFSHEDFPHPLLRAVFADLVAWVEKLGYELSWRRSVQAVLEQAGQEVGAPRSRLLIYGCSAESWGEFFHMAALARRCGPIEAILPEPAFGRKGLDEEWVRLWEAFLGVESELLEDSDQEGRRAVAELWTEQTGEAEGFEILVGRSVEDEMTLVAQRVIGLLAGGAQNIGVVFPGPGNGESVLGALLRESGILFTDQLDRPGGRPIETRIYAAVLAYYEQGGRLEEFLELWKLLGAVNRVELSYAAARRACERLFDDVQSHRIDACRGRMADAPNLAELGRIADALPAWAEEITVQAALASLERTCEELGVEPPAGWGVLADFACRETRPLPAGLVARTLARFLAQPPAQKAVSDGGRFCRVTLTTRRRAEGQRWDGLIFTRAVDPCWPRITEASCWLPDPARRELNRRGRFSLGLFTRDDRAALERDSYLLLATNTCGPLVLSGSLFDPAEPESRLSPNAWMERLLYCARDRDPQREAGPWSPEAEWERRASCASSRDPVPDAQISAWMDVRAGRLDAERPFDEFFYCAGASGVRPRRLGAVQIERGLRDPVELWYGAVLGIERVGWLPFARARRKAIGQRVHRLLARALRPGDADPAAFLPLDSADACFARLEDALAEMERGLPGDAYWQSFLAELSTLARWLLEKVLPRADGGFVATEYRLPPGLRLSVAHGEIEVHGRMDLVILDRPDWAGARATVIDFKTGSDRGLSAARMGLTGEGAQLGIYLAAAQALGASEGEVVLIKPETAAESSLSMSELEEALRPLDLIHRHLLLGIYGQLTPERTEYTYGFEAPLACAPIPSAVLRQKFALSLGAFPEEGA